MTSVDGELFLWPIITDEDLAAIEEVVRNRAMSRSDITKQFEQEYADWNGVKYALGTCNGTAALAEAFWACGIGAGDEVIAPSLTYWASVAPAVSFGASVNFADVETETYCIDPDDIEHRISPRTKAIVAVNYSSMPADWDRILPIARKHNLYVIEDNSHAHGSMYKGRMCGSFGDVAAASMMTGKSFAVGEAGILTTNDRVLYERCIAFGHYERTGLPSLYNPADAQVHQGDLTPFSGLPMGGVKHRMNQTCSAMARVQLKHYPARIAEIQKAMNYFCDAIETIPGLRAIRMTGEDSGNGGWYVAKCAYDSAAFCGVSCVEFCEALAAEGVHVRAGANNPLHLHNFFHKLDLFQQGKPTVLAFGQCDTRQGTGTLPVTEKASEKLFNLPWFKHFEPTKIDPYIEVFRKIAANVSELK